MPDRPQNRRSKVISEEAADWFVCIQSGEMTDEEKRDYVRWLKISPAHVREMLELVNLEQALKAAHPSVPKPAEPPPAASTTSNVVPLTPVKQRQEVPG